MNSKATRCAIVVVIGAAGLGIGAAPALAAQPADERAGFEACEAPAPSSPLEELLISLGLGEQGPTAAEQQACRERVAEDRAREAAAQETDAEADAEAEAERSAGPDESAELDGASGSRGSTPTS